MPHMSYSEQIQDQLNFLRSQGLDVEELQVDTGKFVRCHKIGITKGERDFVYKCQSKKLNNGLFGLGSWCRGINGQKSYQTFGNDPTETECLRSHHDSADSAKVNIGHASKEIERHTAAARKAYGFWMHSSEAGKSDYLQRKGVGYYGIRFRCTELYGNVAVIPMFDIDGRLWNRQLLNADGTKIMATDGRTTGLFHALGTIKPGQTFGIAESYATAATCMEVIGMPVVCAFSGWNLKEVALALAQKNPTSRVIIFADNDRHLSTNKGIEYGQAAVNALGKRAILVAPNFGDRSPSKDESDWNDFVRSLGHEAMKSQLKNI